MNKRKFLDEINLLKNSEDLNITILAKILSNQSQLFTEKIDFKLETSKKKLYIILKKDKKELNIDLIKNFLNIRICYAELNFFIDEIDSNVLELIFKNLFLGNYILYFLITENSKVSRIYLKWDDSSLSNYNSEDIFELTNINNKTNIVKGFNWSKLL